MKVKHFLTLFAFTCLFAITLLVPLIGVYASSDNWVEVKRFSGAGSDSSTTDYFTCDHVEWRIKWDYAPDSDFEEYAVFGVTTYEQGDDIMFIDMVTQMGHEKTEGISYIHNKDGVFYMKFNVANTESFTVIIEQDVNSIPEYSTGMIVPIMIAITLVVILSKRKLDQKN